MKPMRAVQWTCIASPDWEWISGSEGNPGFPVRDDGVRQGIIALPPNKGYWYPCITLGLKGGTVGNAFLVYYEENGQPVVQAITIAQGQWIEKGDPGPIVSQTHGRGGINLFVQLLP